MTKPVFNSRGFGISNGDLTILALLSRFYATNTSKISIIGALLSLLLTDPIGDSYSIYISIKDSNKTEASDIFKKTWLYQSVVQGLFLLIIYLSPSMSTAYIISIIYGMGLVLYDYNKRLQNKSEIILEISKIIGLIIITFSINMLFYKSSKHQLEFK